MNWDYVKNAHLCAVLVVFLDTLCPDDMKICYKLGVNYARERIAGIEDSANSLNQSLTNDRRIFGKSLFEFRQMRLSFKHALENDIDAFYEHRMRSRYPMYKTIVDDLLKNRRMDKDVELRSNLNHIKEDYKKQIHDIHKKFVSVFNHYSKLTDKLENNKTKFDNEAYQKFNGELLINKGLIDKKINGKCKNALVEVHSNLQNELVLGIKHFITYETDFVKKMKDILMESKEFVKELIKDEKKTFELLKLRLNEEIYTKKKIEATQQQAQDDENSTKIKCQNKTQKTQEQLTKEAAFVRDLLEEAKNNLKNIKVGFQDLIVKL